MAALAASVFSACSTSEPVTETGNGITEEQTVRESAEIEARSLFIRGITAMQLDDLYVAEIHLNKAHELKPGEPGILFALADLYYDLGDMVNGIHYNRQAVALAPENRWYRIQLARGHHAGGNYEEAISQLDTILQQRPSDIGILRMKARIHNEQGNYEASNQTYQRILDLTGPDLTTHYQRITNFNRLDDTRAVIDELRTVLQLDPGNMNALMMLSQLYLDEGADEEAQNALEQALKRNPRNPELLVNLADIHIGNEQWDQAGALLNELISDPSVSPGNKFEIMQFIISRFASDPDDLPLRETAETLVTSLLETEPDHGMSHAMAAEFYLTARKEDKALLHLRKTTELMPENDAAWRQLIQTHYVAGNYEQAVETGKKADEYVPEDAFIHFFVGGSYFLKARLEEAAVWLASASELPARPQFRSVILGTLADTYAALERWDQADLNYEEAIALNPENDVALNNYAFYLSERNERLDQAKEMAIRALEINPDNSAFLDTMGWIYFKMGEYENAYKYIRASIETGDASAEVLEHMGDVYDKLGEPDRAHYWWQKALEEDESRTHLKERLHIN
ncbi:tetratricopeptide repeat protein [Balneolales bacterium ANBcel1]|nr:tetratricopeptide repeat protein [Balneolales bacterium ANBcel1]